MTTSPPESSFGPEDPDLVTFVVPRAYARATHQFLSGLNLVVGQAPPGVVPMAQHDTYMAVPDPLVAEHLAHLAYRFGAARTPGPFETTRIVRTPE